MTSKSKESSAVQKRILLTGARSPCALELARLLSKAGHTVFAADTTTFHVLKFSNSVQKFYAIPSPRFDTTGFIEHLLEIVKKEKIDLLIPIWEEVMYLSLHLKYFPSSCKVFCSPFKLIHTLHHKWNFIKLLESFHLQVPDSVLLKNKEDLTNFSFEKPYVLKRCFSRGSRFILKMSSKELPSITVEQDNPWIAQEYITGNKFCSFSVCQKGKVLAHTTYPVEYTIDGNSCVAFESIDHSKIFYWIRDFVQKIGYTGQIAFDFIETKEGVLYPIECNPRATSGLHLFKPEDGLDRAYLAGETETIFPKNGNSQQIAAGMLLYGLREGVTEKRLYAYMKKLITTKDVVFSSFDIKPFLFEPFVLTAYWVRSRHLGISLPLLFTYDLDWDEDREEEKLSCLTQDTS